MALVSARAVDGMILRTAGVFTLVVGAVMTIIGVIVSGVQGFIAGVLATVIVLVFFSIGQFVLGKVLANNPQIAMSVAMLMYLVKIGVLLVLLLLFADTTAFNTKVFAITIVLCTLTWTGAEVWVFARTKVLIVEPGSHPGEGVRDTRHEAEK